MNDLSLPKGWEWKKLGEVVLFKGGSQPPKNEFSDIPKPNFVRLIQIRDYKSNNYITYVNADSVKKFCEENDVMIGRYGPPVFQILRGLKGAYNVALIKAIPNEALLLKDYLFWFLQNSQIQDHIISLSQRSAGQSGVDKNALEKFKILIPPLPEQRRIVAKIDAAFTQLDEAIQLQKQNLARTGEMKKSVLEEVFGDGKWEIKKLGEICNFRNGINYSRESNGEEIKIVGVKDFQNSFWAPLDYLASIVIDGHLSEIDLLQENDILTVRSNGNQDLIGRCILVGKVKEKTSHSGFTIRIRTTASNVFPQYLCHYLKSEKARRNLIESGIGANIKSLNQTALSTLDIPLTSLPEQQKIVAHLDQAFARIDALQAEQNARLQHLESLKSSILAEAFQGKL